MRGEASNTRETTLERQHYTRETLGRRDWDWDWERGERGRERELKRWEETGKETRD